MRGNQLLRSGQIAVFLEIANQPRFFVFAENGKFPDFFEVREQAVLFNNLRQIARISDYHNFRILTHIFPTFFQLILKYNLGIEQKPFNISEQKYYDFCFREST